MKNVLKFIFWIIVIIGGFYFLSQQRHSIYSSSPNNLPSSNNADDDSGVETTNYSYNEAISNNWDDIKPYVNGSETIDACSDSSGNCYNLEVDISDGCINEIHFENGGYLDFSSACLDENGKADDTDNEGNSWTFTVDMGSTIITDAVDNWASDNGYTIE